MHISFRLYVMACLTLISLAQASTQNLDVWERLFAAANVANTDEILQESSRLEGSMNFQNPRDEYMTVPMILAKSCGHLHQDALKAILNHYNGCPRDKFDLNIRQNNRELTALGLAVRNGNRKGAWLLVRARADIGLLPPELKHKLEGWQSEWNQETSFENTADVMSDEARKKFQDVDRQMWLRILYRQALLK